MGIAYQENDGNVQQECDTCICEEGSQTNCVDFRHLNVGNFPEKSNGQVHDSADWRKVVQ